MKLAYIKLAWIAAKCVCKTMIEGERKHPTGDGFQELEYQHLYHIANHTNHEYKGDRSEDHIAHIMTRCAMIKYLENR